MLTVTKLSFTIEEEKRLLADTVAFSNASAPPAIVFNAYACLRRRKGRTKPLEVGTTCTEAFLCLQLPL